MKVNLITSSLVIAVSSSVAFASNPKCQGLRDELQALQRAQAQIVQSLVSNHESFAEVLEEYSMSSTKAPVATAQEMKKSARSFRERGLQGQRLAARLRQSTEDLVARVDVCLK